MKKRLIWEKLKKEIATLEVVVITGPRQVGKTTTLKWLMEEIPSQNKIYFDLENLVDRELFEVKNYDSLLGELERRGLNLKKKIYVALDEIQLLPNLPSIIKYLHDHYQIKFFLSGSSAFYIKNRFTESMAGRKIIYEMFPLTFQEFLDFKEVEYNLPLKLSDQGDFSVFAYQKLHDLYDEYIEYGGLPKVVLTADVERKKELLAEIFSSYINLDVQVLADFKSTRDLRKLIKILAARVGSKLNISELANIIGLSRITVDNYLEFLEQTYLIRTLPVFSRSADVQQRSQRKLYFIDTGIANLNADLSGGSKFENTVCHQLYNYGKISYFSNRDGEVDFIITNGKKQLALEVKVTPTDADQRVLTRRANQLGIKDSKLIGKEPAAKFDSFIWGGMIR